MAAKGKGVRRVRRKDVLNSFHAAAAVQGFRFAGPTSEAMPPPNRRLLKPEEQVTEWVRALTAEGYFVDRLANPRQIQVWGFASDSGGKIVRFDAYPTTKTFREARTGAQRQYGGLPGLLQALKAARVTPHLRKA